MQTCELPCGFVLRSDRRIAVPLDSGNPRVAKAGGASVEQNRIANDRAFGNETVTDNEERPVVNLTYEDREDGVRLIHLSGRLDLEGSQQIDLKFAALTALDQRTVVVDLTEVDFVASLGLATLVHGARTLGARGGRLLLAGPQENVAKMLNATQIGRVIPVFDDVALALAAGSGTSA
jgi:anti-anti-sigma factor